MEENMRYNLFVITRCGYGHMIGSITLLQLGEEGLRRLYTERMQHLPLLIDGLDRISRRYKQRVLVVPKNSISIGMSLLGVDSAHATAVGSALFKKLVSGTRVVQVTIFEY